MCKFKNKFESLIYFLQRLDHHIQDEEWENVRRRFTLGLFIALILKLLTKYGNISSIFHSDKISGDSKC